MSSVSSYVWSQMVQGFTYITSSGGEDPCMKVVPSIGPREWKDLAGIDVKPEEIPSPLLEVSKRPSPFSPEHTIAQTHILCCVPEGLSVAKLYQVVGKSTSFLNNSHYQENKNTYWCWVAKKPILKYLSFKLQQKELDALGYDTPTRLEAMVAIYAAKVLGDLILFPNHENAIACKSTDKGDSYDIIGGDQSATFCGYADSWRSIGTTSVIRS